MSPELKAADCPKCGSPNPAGAGRCGKCGWQYGSDDATVTNALGADNWSRARVQPVSSTTLEVGGILAERYEILQLLGEGGMGAVYKARDRELDRLVALKVIRPELASHPDILQRFKQELILARKITHRNVIRIYDLGIADGLRFITMEFVEGQDLASVLAEKKYAPHEAMPVLRQVCDALDAAHTEGVVHRDLKPNNIMLEPGGRVCVMDFGLARSLEATGLTQAGAIMGTPAYMSPEQAKGETADARSDIFSLGIIAYQMLTGKVPFKGDTALSSMLLRTQGPPPAPAAIDPGVPAPLSDVVLKALATKPDDRYQSAQQFSQDLRDWQEGALARSIVTPRMAMMSKSNTARWVGLSIAAAVVVAGGILGALALLRKGPSGPHAPVTVMIADFNNHTGDPIFDGTLEPVLKIALEGAEFITAYDRTQVSRLLGLPPVAGRLDEPAARQIAVGQGLNVVVSGSLERDGAGYAIAIKAVQAVTGNSMISADDKASNKDQVLFTATKLASAVRTALGDDTSESARRFGMETLTATSLEAVHDYSVAMDALSNGKHEDALRNFSKAVDVDQNFGLAYAGMAIAARNLGQQQEAEKHIREATRHTDRMTERERYRTRGSFYLLIGDQQKCVEEYGELIKRYPADAAAHNNVALCSTQLRNMPAALEEVRKAAAILPKRALYRLNTSIYAAYGSDFQTAEREARAVQEMDPSYDSGFLALAFAKLGQERLSEAGEEYKKLEKLGRSAASRAAAGLADLALYEGRLDEAARLFEQGAAADLANRYSDRAAAKFATLAYAQLLKNRRGPALAAAQNALKNSTLPKVRFLAARVYGEAGDNVKARELAAGLAAELPAESQAYAKLIEGEIALTSGDARQAIQSFTQANSLLDTWIGRFELGRAYLEAEAFAQADSEFDRCVERRGEALALFLDEVPTYGYFPPVYYYQGRVREGLKSPGAAESYRKYVSIRGKAGEDPLLADARRRAGR